MRLSLVLDWEVADDLSSDPLARNGNDLLSLAIHLCLERSFTVPFGAKVLLHEVPEGPGAYLGYPQEIVLALDQAYGETVDTKYVLALERIRVVSAQHVLVAQKIREDSEQGMSHWRVADLAYPAQ